MNKAILLGNLGEDPELRHTNSGTAVMNLRMATTDRYKDKQSGEWQERTDWHNVVLWGARAEALEKFLRKGSKIMVEGSLQTRSWEDKSGVKKYKTEVNAREIELCDGKKGAGGGSEQRQSSQQQAATNTDAFGPDDDDIPF